MIAEPNRKKKRLSSFGLERAQPMRGCQDSANEKPPHFKCSVSNEHFVYYSFPNFLSLKDLSSPCWLNTAPDFELEVFVDLE